MDFQKNIRRTGSLLSAFLLFVVSAANAQTNLLVNPGAEDGMSNWRAYGKSTIEQFNGQNIFVIRDHEGSKPIPGFVQDVTLSRSDVGKFALLIGHASTEQINADGAITGLPYLYGYMLESNNRNGGRINAYLQQDRMLARPSKPNQWVTIYGIFQVPQGTVAIRFFLNQASRRGVPANGSAARFDNAGLFLFETEEEALNFVKGY